MAISKILYIGDCGSGYAGKHLKQALDYIAEDYKTGGGQWVSALNCQIDEAYEQMHQTKVQFGKTDQRQGYHMIISFAEGEVDAGRAFEVIGRFAKAYLEQDYEALYAVHDNTAHVHGHIIFNSVSFRTGNKFRYKKGDWAREIQPITNKLCEEYGLSTIEIAEERVQPAEHYKEWNDFRDGKFVWADMIKRDMDACILRAPSYESFLTMLSEMGYEIKNAYRGEGKYLSIKPMGLTRFRRCKSFGEDYSEERIRERIENENLFTYQKMPKRKEPKIVHCKIKRYQKAKMSGVQKRYFAKMYRVGLLKKRSYSQTWKYCDDIRKMKKLQEDYLFLVRHGVHTAAGVAAVAENMTDRKRETAREKSRIFKARAKMKKLFDMALELEKLQESENCYQNGGELFAEEHERYAEISAKIEQEGYSVEQIEEIRQHYRNEIARVRDKEKAVFKEERIAKRILAELQNTERKKEQTKEKEENKKVEKIRQPIL